MDLFKPVVSPDKYHKNFSFALHPLLQKNRDLFNEWAHGFVDRDNKLVQEFQTTFNSSFWEIYLYRLFKDYGFDIDWSHPSPDFCLSCNGTDIVVEATIANAAHDKPNEWDRSFGKEEIEELKRVKFRELNTEAIIRLSNAISAKYQKLKESYGKLNHVRGKPFVLAISPYEQPLFNLQYDRPIRALLYDYYVDEDAYLSNLSAYPDGPPAINLGHVKKDNGSEIILGLFTDDYAPEISAIVFSCTATWGKLSAMLDYSDRIVISVWGTPPDGTPTTRKCVASEHEETMFDGLQVFHNPFANHPLPREVFRALRVVQHYFDKTLNEWIYEGRTDALHFRSVMGLNIGEQV